MATVIFGLLGTAVGALVLTLLLLRFLLKHVAFSFLDHVEALLMS